MSGLDGLGWPNPEDEPKQNKTMNSQLEIKLAPTPETDAMEYFDAMCDPDRVVEADFARKLERERDVVTEQRDRLAAAVNAATVLIAAKGRHNTLLAYEGLRSALSPQNARDLAPPPQMPELDK